MMYCSESMSITIGDFSKSSERNSEGTPCRLCMKKNDYFHNIFTSIVTSQITVEDALYHLVDLKVAVGDGLPAIICSLCLKKLIEFNDFRNICHKSDAELRKYSSGNYVRALKGCAEADGPEGDHPEKHQSHEDDEDESFCLLLESDSDEGDEGRNSDAGTMVDADCDHMQAQASTSSQGEKVDAEETGAIVIVQDSMPVLAEKETPKETDATEALASTSFQWEEVDAEETGSIVIDLDSLPVLANKESPKETDATEPTSMENGELIQKQTMTMESMTEALDLPAPERASAVLTRLEPKIRASNSRKAWKVMDIDIEICGSQVADERTLCSIPGDGQFHSKPWHVSKIRGDRATTTVVGEISGCDNPDTTKSFRVNNTGKSGPKAVVRENKEMSSSMIKNPGKRARSKDNSYHCFNCGDAFKAKFDLIEHLNIHCGSGSLDIDANLSIGKHLALKTLFSRGESNSSYQPTSSESLNKLPCKKQGVRQKRNWLLKENVGETREKINAREVRKSFLVDGKSCTDSSHTTKTPNYCGECEKYFSQKSDFVRHIRTHTKEKPYSCGECEKSFSYKNSLVRHIRTHTKEKPFSCNECEKSFSDRSNLVCHMRIHTKEKPYSCGECKRSFSRKSHLIYHIRTHTKDKPYSCGECEKSFSHKNSLVYHTRTHTKEKPFSCYECEKSFSVRSNLLRHMKIHTKEIRYSCSECEKSFSGKSNLARHIRTHTKEKRYSCGECQQSYNTKRNLVLHKRVHRKEALLLH